ncbi:peptidase M29 [Hydrogenophaga sp.]|uniref:peptidase M29 n=1 Tax=Hydrogenophaga sp. TaxID=1904254 RepID=UPI003567621F
MLQERTEPAWVDAFEAVLRRCALQAGDSVAILAETQSRAVLPELARLAAARLGAQVFMLTLPSVFSTGAPLTRSNGASPAIQQMAPVIAALQACALVVDCTVEGLMHAPELPAILQGNGSTQPRIVYVSNEHPEALARLLPDDATEARVKAHVKRLRAARRMRVTSEAGTDLSIGLQDAVTGGNWGSTTRPGTLTHWPGGLVLAFPATGSVNGTLVLDVGDVNLSFKRYIESPITLTIQNDHVVHIDGSGVDAELMRSHFAAWADEDRFTAGPPQGETSPLGGQRPAQRRSVGAPAYAVSHVGYGLNESARWDSMALYDKRDFNGTELRAFAGNFLYSTGANETAGRFTQAHFDLPMRHCTVLLDDTPVVQAGRVLDLPTV